MQTFEFDVEGNGGSYTYRLEVEHSPNEGRCRVFSEKLTFSGGLLYDAGIEKDGTYRAHLYRDNHSKGPDVLADWTRSGVYGLQPRNDNSKLTWFRKRVSSIRTICIDPWGMEAVSDKEVAVIRDNMSNFASWYRHLAQDSPSITFALYQDLKELIAGFEDLKLAEVGESARALRLRARCETSQSNGGAIVTFNWKELSDGQRVLIALYALLHGAVGADQTLVIDEPENFVALSEIQPWLVAVVDKVRSERGQVILISHHPEVHNYLANDYGALIERPSGGPARVRPWSSIDTAGLEPAKLLARGWENG